MRLLLALTLKDLRRTLADPAGTLLSLAIPLAIAGTMALAFGGGGTSHPVLQVVLVDLDDTPISNSLAGASQNEDAAEHLVVHRATTRSEGLAALRATRSAAMVVIPEGFMKDLLEGRATRLAIEKNPSQSIMPVVADQGLQAVALYLSVGRRLLGNEAARVLDLLEGEGWEETLALATMVETLRQRVLAVDDLLLPPLIEVGTAAHEEEAEETGGAFEFLSWMYPGMMVMALLFVGTVQMRDLLRESKQGTLRRLLASPLGADQVLLSKVLAVATVVAIAHVVLLLLGWLAFGMTWSDGVALALASVALIGAVTGFNALIFAAARTEGQGDAFGGVLIMLMSILGGAFVPTQAMPGWLQGVSRGTLNHWANAALRGVASGGGLDEIAVPLLALAGMAVTFILFGVALLRFRHLRGTA